MMHLQDGRTALMAAIEGGDKEIVEILLDSEDIQCDINIQERVYYVMFSKSHINSIL